MRKIKLTIAYDGTCFRGWQVQPGERTVQGVLEDAARRLVHSEVRVHASGRTDAGTHASGQVAHLEFPENIPLSNIPAAINGLLPEDVAITRAEEVPDAFHARFSAKSKTYRYRILLSSIPDPFEERYAWRIDRGIDVKLMKKELRGLKGEHDLSAFRASGSSDGPAVRRVLACSLRMNGNILEIDVEATGFLYNMMRNIVGTLVEIGRGYFTRGSLGEIMLSRQRSKAGPTAPAKGLFLVEVRY